MRKMAKPGLCEIFFVRPEKFLNNGVCSGSRVAFKSGTLRADFHRPHPNKEAKPYQVRAVREFLQQLEIEP